MSFETSLKDLLETEGGFVHDPTDKGGATNYGITLKTLSDFLGHEANEEQLHNITMDTVKQIYRQNYWDRLSLGKFKDQDFAQLIFDQAVNRGTRKVAEQLQLILGVKADGAIGPITLQALHSRDPKKLMLDFIKSAQNSYTSIVSNNPSQLKFLSGWIKRTHLFLDYLAR